MEKSVEYHIKTTQNDNDAPIEADFEGNGVHLSCADQKDCNGVNLTAQQFDEIAHARQVFLKLEQVAFKPKDGDVEEAVAMIDEARDNICFPEKQQVDGK